MDRKASGRTKWSSGGLCDLCWQFFFCPHTCLLDPSFAFVAFLLLCSRLMHAVLTVRPPLRAAQAGVTPSNGEARTG